MLHPGKGNNTVRAVFITDPDSIIRAMLYYPQELGRNMDEILRMVKGLQKADQEKVAIPANWPENEILKEKVIPPPAADEKTAQKRRGRKNCYDWWFCYKN
jgi:peroxiredoxin (alkyl hydroperoxide reductase subunit C)